MRHSGRWLTGLLILLMTVPFVSGHHVSYPLRVIPKEERKPIRPMVPDIDRNASDKVFLEHADTLRYREHGIDIFSGMRPEQYQVLVGNVVFRKGGMMMYCDSAYMYEDSESFDAFSNVRMEQGDTLFVYGDELRYDGIDALAILYASPGKKVRLINRDVELTTDVFNYDMNRGVGYYDVGGELRDKTNILTSREGEYYPSTKFAYFYRNVVLESDGREDTLHMYTDSLIYNTDTHIAQIIDRTRIVNKDGEINSTSGFYNTETGLADLYSRSTVVTRRGNTLTGDTLMYDRNAGFGEAYGSMVFTDSARQTTIEGDYGYYNELNDSAFVTGRAVAKEYSRGDTLYMHGDTINAFADIDSMRVINLFHRVRFYRSDMQGLCDSMSYAEVDSVMYMYRHPIVWSNERQIFGNVIYLHLNDSVLDWVRLPDFAFTVEHIGEDCYNQMSGSDMTAWFEDNELHRLYIEGNLQMIMFPMENDSTVNKYAYIESSYLDAYFKDKALSSGRIWPENNGTVTPLYLARKNSYFLPKFAWYEELRPRTPGEIFVIPQEMLDLIASAPPVEQRKRLSRKDARPSPSAPDAVSTPDSVPGMNLSAGGLLPDVTTDSVGSVNPDSNAIAPPTPDLIPDTQSTSEPSAGNDDPVGLPDVQHREPAVLQDDPEDSDNIL